MPQQMKATAKLIAAMLIFGSIGLFVRLISLHSGLIAMFRAIIGTLILIALMALRRSKLSFASIRKNLLLLCVSGTAIGFNWILLFESYQYTSVAVGTLCYYMAPMIVLLVSPWILKERLTFRKCLCIFAAFVGMVLISGIASASFSKDGGMKGIGLGLGAAILYASVILMNKHINNVGALEKTVVQLAAAAIVLIPYNLLTVNFSAVSLNITTLGLLALVGIVHTGFAYYLYFGSMVHLGGHRIAIYSYIDPVIAVLSSAIVLQEPFTWYNALGALLILGAALICELPPKQRRE